MTKKNPENWHVLDAKTHFKNEMQAMFSRDEWSFGDLENIQNAYEPIFKLAKEVQVADDAMKKADERYKAAHVLGLDTAEYSDVWSEKYNACRELESKLYNLVEARYKKISRRR